MFLKLVKDSKSLYVLLLDADDSGYNASKQLSEELKELNIKHIEPDAVLKEIKAFKLDDCKDPNEMLLKDSKQFKELLKQLHSLSLQVDKAIKP